jgi:hypothetical protein
MSPSTEEGGLGPLECACSHSWWGSSSAALDLILQCA